MILKESMNVPLFKKKSEKSSISAPQKPQNKAIFDRESFLDPVEQDNNDFLEEAKVETPRINPISKMRGIKSKVANLTKALSIEGESTDQEMQISCTTDSESDNSILKKNIIINLQTPLKSTREKSPASERVDTSTSGAEPSNSSKSTKKKKKKKSSKLELPFKEYTGQKPPIPKSQGSKTEHQSMRSTAKNTPMNLKRLRKTKDKIFLPNRELTQKETKKLISKTDSKDASKIIKLNDDLHDVVSERKRSINYQKERKIHLNTMDTTQRTVSVAPQAFQPNPEEIRKSHFAPKTYHDKLPNERRPIKARSSYSQKKPSHDQIYQKNANLPATNNPQPASALGGRVKLANIKKSFSPPPGTPENKHSGQMLYRYSSKKEGELPERKSLPQTSATLTSGTSSTSLTLSSHGKGSKNEDTSSQKGRRLQIPSNSITSELFKKVTEGIDMKDKKYNKNSASKQHLGIQPNPSTKTYGHYSRKSKQKSGSPTYQFRQHFDFNKSGSKYVKIPIRNKMEDYSKEETINAKKLITFKNNCEKIPEFN